VYVPPDAGEVIDADGAVGAETFTDSLVALHAAETGLLSGSPE
jgi:hypothetical protein